MKHIVSLLTALLLLSPSPAFAADVFVDIGVTNVSGLTMELAKCADRNISNVRVDGQFYGNVHLDNFPFDTYNIPFDDPTAKVVIPIEFEIEQCAGGVHPNFKLNGKLFSFPVAAGASIPRASQAVKTTGGGQPVNTTGGGQPVNTTGGGQPVNQTGSPNYGVPG